MATSTRERDLISAFIELADTLVAGYDIVDLLHDLVNRSAHILGSTGAGILLPGETGALEVVASTSERSHLISLLQLDADQGPCVDAYRTGHLVTVDDIAAVYARWPEFAVAAGALGFQAMHAIPLRLRSDTIGSLNMFSDTTGPLSAENAAAAQGLADIATIGILQERALRESHAVQEQLQHALSSRVLIEQAKGVLAQSENIEIDEAFQRIRSRARNEHRLLSDVAQEIVDGVRSA